VLLLRVRAALAATVAIGSFVLFAVPGPSSAVDPVGSPTLTLLGQSESVTPAAPGDPATFQLDVDVRSAPDGAELGLTFYEQLGTRSAFEQTLTSPPTGVLQALPPVPIADLKSGLGGLDDGVTVVPDTSEPAGSNAVDLGCRHVGNGTCSGVYPVLVQLLGPSGNAISHFTTYLTYAEERSPNPLVFSWVVPIAAPVHLRSAGSLSDALSPLSPTRVSDLAKLAQSLLDNPSVQVSIAASPATVQRLGDSTSRNARQAVADLTKLAAGGAAHRFIAEPYVPVNLGALEAAGVTEEIAGQLGGAEAVMDPLLRGLPAADQRSSATWVASGAVDAATVDALGSVHATSLVLPDTDLPPATEEAHATWSQPFTLTAGRSQGVTAAVSDAQLSSYFTSEAGDPALAATQLLADLSVIYFELPGAGEARGVIAIPASSWDPNPGFVDTLLGGLTNNPVVTTATLPEFFTTVPLGGNDAETSRHLAAGESGQPISPGEADAIVTARKQISGFDDAVQGAPAAESQLDELLLAAESSELKPAQQGAGIAAVERHLAAELANVQVVDNSVTVTARTASIPITIVSSADFSLRATLHLHSPKLQFPEGATRTVSIDHPTNSTRIEVRARTSGDLPLSYTLKSPDGLLVIASGGFTVRSTATSIVGIVLTLVAAVVLLGWWARTWRRGRRQRRARPARGAPT
jgi:hypothetical protein